MDSGTLVNDLFTDGQVFINTLIARNFDVTAAAWVKPSEESAWLLYIGSGEVDKKGLAGAYQNAYGWLHSELPAARISPSEIKLIGSTNPVTRELLAIRNERGPTWFYGPTLGSLTIDEAYVYPPFAVLRWPFSVSYTRQGESNNWQARAEPRELMKGVDVKGAVAYTTGGWVGDPAHSERYALVTVFLEVGPQFYDPAILKNPGVRRELKRQAAAIADEMFKTYHRDAMVEYVDDEELKEAAWRRTQEAAAQAKSTALFVGGPYDGMRVHVTEINTFCHVTPISTKRGIRLFVLIPPREVWEDLRNGLINKDGPFDVLYTYERKFGGGGAEFQYCSGDEIGEALKDQ